MTETTTKILEILKDDEYTQKMLAELNKVADETQPSHEEYKMAREIILLDALRKNPEAVKLMSDSVWNRLHST